MMFCWLWHDWSEWTDQTVPQKPEIPNAVIVGYVARVVQARRCAGCGKVELRKVEVSL